MYSSLKMQLLSPEKIASRSLKNNSVIYVNIDQGINNTLVYIDIDYQGIHYFISGGKMR